MGAHQPWRRSCTLSVAYLWLTLTSAELPLKDLRLGRWGMGPFGNQTECGQHNVTYKNGDDWGMVDGITPLFYPPFSTTG